MDPEILEMSFNARKEAEILKADGNFVIIAEHPVYSFNSATIGYRTEVMGFSKDPNEAEMILLTTKKNFFESCVTIY